METPAELAGKSSMLISRRKSILHLTTLLACLTVAVPVKAQEYSFRYYGTEDGLTNLAVKVLFQDRTGFLWAGTEGGVFRYDGEWFQRYGSAEGLPQEVVLSLGEVPDGSVLAGYRGASINNRAAVSKECHSRAEASIATARFSSTAKGEPSSAPNGD